MENIPTVAALWLGLALFSARTISALYGLSCSIVTDRPYPLRTCLVRKWVRRNRCDVFGRQE
jgi:hypothetical protein